MASIRQAANGKWNCRWREGGGRNGREVSETFDRRADAVRFKGLVDAAGQRYPEGWVPRHGFVVQSEHGPLLEEWFEQALAANTRANPTTKDDYRALFRKHVPTWLKTKPIEQITRHDAGLWLNELAATRYGDRRISEKTIHNVQGILSSVLNQALLDGLVARNPFAGLLRSRDPVAPAEQVFLTRKEFELVLAHAPEHPDSRAALELMFHTGLRVGEATVLRPENIDLDRCRLHVTHAWKRGDFLGLPKSSRSRRFVAFGDRIAELLEPRVARGGLLFRNAHGEQLMQASLRVYTWNPAVAAAQEEGFTKTPRMHDLRHSHASYLLSNGVPLIAVSRRLGHASIQITADRYGHLLPEADEALRRLL